VKSSCRNSCWVAPAPDSGSSNTISEGVLDSTLKVLNVPALLVGAGEGAGGGGADGPASSSVARLRFREPPLAGGGDMLCWMRKCLWRASGRVKDLSHSWETNI
jgi:hypothetical protein